MKRTYTSFSSVDWLTSTLVVLAWAAVAGWAGLIHAADKSSSQLESPTHRQVRLITPEVDGKSVKLHTIATNADGHLIVALGGKSVQFERASTGMQIKEVEEPGVVQMLDSEGEVLQQWELDITPSSIGVAPDGVIYIGGNGKIVQLDDDGGVQASMESPHVGDIAEFQKRTADAMRKSMAGMSDTYETQIETLKERIAAIEEKDDDDRTRLEDAQLQAFESQLEMFEKLVVSNDEDSEEDDAESDMLSAQIDYAVHQSMMVTSLAVSDQDVFACASGGGLGGFAVWRISRDLEPASSKQIKDGLGGCCGQMDIQCCEDNLLISENTRFKVGVYDREGERVADFGGRDRTSRAGFGSCCNPMNSMSMSDGTILTAESSIGHIKRFDIEGNLVAYIGKANIGGGCKHCALGYDEKQDLYYMMYQDKNAICVLANNDSHPISLAEKELLQRQTDFLARAAGQWSMDGVKEKKKSLGGAIASLFGGGRGGSSPHPIASLKVGSDGSAKILEGMYQAYGDAAQIELVSAEDGTTLSKDEVSFALAIDQVRFLEGTWTFADDETATLAFTGHQSVTLKRAGDSESCESSCGGKECENPDCEDDQCPQQLVAVTKKPMPKKSGTQAMRVALPPAKKTTSNDPTPVIIGQTAESDVAVELNAPLEYDDFSYSETAPLASYDSMAIPKPTFAYKLIQPKRLGSKLEDKLNKLGAGGWEYCGKVGKEMLFKRIEQYKMTGVTQ